MSKIPAYLIVYINNPLTSYVGQSDKDCMYVHIAIYVRMYVHATIELMVLVYNCCTGKAATYSHVLVHKLNNLQINIIISP